MARTGLYKSEVKKARDTLLAHGKHPSVDAVRIELGIPVRKPPSINT
jgi:hypothetical protein